MPEQVYVLMNWTERTFQGVYVSPDLVRQSLAITHEKVGGVRVVEIPAGVPKWTHSAYEAHDHVWITIQTDLHRVADHL